MEKVTQVIDVQSNSREGNPLVWTVYSLTKLLTGVLVKSMGDHDQVGLSNRYSSLL